MKKDDIKRPDLSIIAQYVRGDNKLMAYWSRFIAQDPESRGKAELLQRLFRMFGAADMQRMSAASQSLAQHIFQSFMSTPVDGADNIARLYYDSRAIPMPEGVRPSLMSARRLKFKAGDGNIELSISPVYPGRFEITGRYKGPLSSENGLAIIKGRRAHRTCFDRFGFFYLAPVDPGQYRLSCRLANHEYLLPTLEL